MASTVSVLRKTLIGAIVAIVVVGAILPLWLHVAALRFVTTQPERPQDLLSEAAIKKYWETQEVCRPKRCARATPYWIYRMGAFVFVEETLRDLNIHVAEIDNAPVNPQLSNMAWRIAIEHRRRHNERVPGNYLMSWHMANAALSLQIQRTWSPAEIATAYSMLETHQAPRLRVGPHKDSDVSEPVVDIYRN